MDSGSAKEREMHIPEIYVRDHRTFWSFVALNEAGVTFLRERLDEGIGEWVRRDAVRLEPGAGRELHALMVSEGVDVRPTEEERKEACRAIFYPPAPD